MICKNHLKKFGLPRKFNPGAFPDRPDNRDRQYEDVVAGAPQVDWEKGYNVEEELNHKFLVESQGSSSSCIGHGWAKYLEVINFAEQNKFKDLSARFIYSQIYLPQGGSYIRSGAKLAVKQGDALEKLVKSYEYIKMSDGSYTKNPPNEEFMRQNFDITAKIRQSALTYQAKEYRAVPPSNPDLIAHAIKNNWGAVSGAHGDSKGWSKYPVQPPKSKNPWGHAFFYTGFGQDAKGKYFDFLNSWGDSWGMNGRGRMYYDEYDMAKNTFSVWTLVDKPNIIHMVRLIQQKDDPTRAVWWVGQDGKRRFFFNKAQFDAMAPAFGINNGFDSLEVLTKEEINKIPVANPWVVIK